MKWTALNGHVAKDIYMNYKKIQKDGSIQMQVSYKLNSYNSFFITIYRINSIKRSTTEYLKN